MKLLTDGVCSVFQSMALGFSHYSPGRSFNHRPTVSLKTRDQRRVYSTRSRAFRYLRFRYLSSKET